MSFRVIRYVLLLTVIGMFVTLIVVTTDNGVRRHYTYEHIRCLVQRVQDNPSDRSSLENLVRYAEGDFSYGASHAAAAFRELNAAAAPAVPVLARLLDSPDGYVAREAALSLRELGPISSPARDALEAQLLKRTDGDVVWFAAEALGNMGSPGIKSLPTLRSRLGTASEILDRRLMSAIETLEAIDKEGKPSR